MTDRTMMDAVAVPIFALTRDGHFSYANHALAALVGARVEEIVGKGLRDYLSPEDAEERLAILAEVFRTGKASTEERRVRRPTGDFYFRTVIQPLRDAAGEVYSVICTSCDVTAHQRAEEVLRASEARYRTLLDWMPQASVVHRAGKLIYVNAATLTLFGATSATELLGRSILDLLHPDFHGIVREHAATKGVTAPPSVATYFRLDGAPIELEVRGTPITYDGEPAVLVALRDVTPQRRADAAQRQCRALLNEAQRTAKVGGWTFDVATLVPTWTDETFRILEFDPSESPTLAPERIAFASPASLQVAQQALLRAVQDGEPFDFECEIITAMGKRRWVNAVAEVHRKDGRITSLSGSVQDITERKVAEQEHSRLETQLRQAQKLESVGRLAGGIAHDFNNMLATILGNVELALEQVDPSGQVYADLKEIRTAARRSADLTHQLSAFARNQAVTPKVVDLNTSVSDMVSMLKRLIGEDIQLTWTPESGLWPVMMDPSQMDQVLINLCVNARDAIDNVGNVAIETRNRIVDDRYCAEHPGCEPGAFVEVVVRDDGCGMDEETLSFAFEPYFTTKEIGKGTGLGLATVYGVVRQNRGFVSLTSAPGAGTTVTVLLPRHTEPTEKASVTDAVGKAQRGTETILLVEDEPTILKMTKRVLEGHGYTVHAANTPATALRLATEHAGNIDLLMTDVNMPEMNGGALAKRLIADFPSIRCLFMSGDTRNATGDDGQAGQRMHFLQKPFSMLAVTNAVRAALRDANPPA